MGSGPAEYASCNGVESGSREMVEEVKAKWNAGEGRNTQTAQAQSKAMNARVWGQLEAAIARGGSADAAANPKNAPHDDDDERAARPQPTEAQAENQSGRISRTPPSGS